MFTLSDIVSTILGELGGERLEPEDVRKFAIRGVETYSQYSPREVAVNLVGDGNTYTKSLDDWVEGFSYVKSIEYPQGQRVPTYLLQKEYTIIDGTVMLYDRTPSASELARIVYTSKHVVTDDPEDCTVPDFMQQAVEYAALWHTVNYLAVYYTRASGRGSGQGNFVLDTKGKDFLALADSIWKQFALVMNFDPDKAVANEGLFFQIPFLPTWGTGSARRFH